jgi:hypothetical protein
MSELFSAAERKRLLPFRSRGMQVMTAFEAHVSLKLGKEFRLHAETDAVRFGFWQLGAVSERTAVSIPALLDLLFQRYAGSSSGVRRKLTAKQGPLGIPLRVLLSAKALEWLEGEARAIYPDAPASAKVQRRLLASLPLTGSPKFSDPLRLRREYRRTLSTVKRKARTLEASARIRPYRGNPWSS